MKDFGEPLTTNGIENDGYQRIKDAQGNELIRMHFEDIAELYREDRAEIWHDLVASYNALSGLDPAEVLRGYVAMKIWEKYGRWEGVYLFEHEGKRVLFGRINADNILSAAKELDLPELKLLERIT